MGPCLLFLHPPWLLLVELLLPALVAAVGPLLLQLLALAIRCLHKLLRMRSTWQMSLQTSAKGCSASCVVSAPDSA